MDFLQQMAERSRERVESARQSCPEAALFERAARTPLPPQLRLNARGFDLIAEIKLRSPAAGALKSNDESIETRAATYASAGAAAVSVLTEPSRFDGSMTHLQSAARALEPFGVPAMRKDFLVDPYQVAEARIAGASGVLVILRMLPRAGIEALLDASRQLGLFVLLEAFDERDIELAQELVAVPASRRKPGSGETNAFRLGNGLHRGDGQQRTDILVGVNCRDLATLQVVPGRLEQLAHLLPMRVPRVAESGVATAQDARSASAAGYDLALVGSSLMKASDPAALISEMLAAGSKR